jgi:hypothetical protein
MTGHQRRRGRSKSWCSSAIVRSGPFIHSIAISAPRRRNAVSVGQAGGWARLARMSIRFSYIMLNFDSRPVRPHLARRTGHTEAARPATPNRLPGVGGGCAVPLAPGFVTRLQQHSARVGAFTTDNRPKCDSLLGYDRRAAAQVRPAVSAQVQPLGRESVSRGLAVIPKASLAGAADTSGGHHR